MTESEIELAVEEDSRYSTVGEWITHYTTKKCLNLSAETLAAKITNTYIMIAPHDGGYSVEVITWNAGSLAITPDGILWWDIQPTQENTLDILDAEML